MPKHTMYQERKETLKEKQHFKGARRSSATGKVVCNACVGSGSEIDEIDPPARVWIDLR